MGVHDYSCVIHGNGEQCLTLHDTCNGTHIEIEHDSDEEPSHDENVGYGGDAILICFDLPSKVSSRSEAYSLLKKGKVKNLRLMKPHYDWDAWDFLDENEPMGYFDILHCPGNDNSHFVLPWKTNNTNRDFKPYKQQFWCMAFCYQCFDVFLTDNKNNTSTLCRKYCQEIC